MQHQVVTVALIVVPVANRVRKSSPEATHDWPLPARAEEKRRDLIPLWLGITLLSVRGQAD
jgi:hypothetical protein